MILTVYAVLLFLALVAVALGVALREPFFSFTGLFFLFLLGLTLMAGDVEYKTGYNETTCDVYESYIYGDNYTGYHFDYEYTSPPALADVNLFHKNITYNGCATVRADVYTSISASYRSTVWWFGFLLSLTSGFGAFALLWTARAAWKQDREKSL